MLVGLLISIVVMYFAVNLWRCPSFVVFSESVILQGITALFPNMPAFALSAQFPTVSGNMRDDIYRNSGYILIHKFPASIGSPSAPFEEKHT